MEASRERQFLMGGGTIVVSKMANSVEWYSNRLGFSLGNTYQGGEQFIYAHLRREGAMLLLLDQASYEEVRFLPPNMPLGGIDLRIKVNDLHALQAELSTKFTAAELEIQARGVTSEIRVKDPDGYVVAFWKWSGSDASSAAG